MIEGKYLHVVAFSVPLPANYGGVIDVFFKIKALHKKGIKIILHCFRYDRAEVKELDLYCEKVYYYKRNLNPLLLFHQKPFIVVSRRSQLMNDRLKANGYPILLEGLHCSSILEDEVLKHRKVFVRAHNIEHDYYNGLAHAESSFFKKLYFKNEAKKLQKYEQLVLPRAHCILSISPSDNAYFNGQFGIATQVNAFHGCALKLDEAPKQNFALYHGNLSVAENIKAAKFLIENIFCDLNEQLIIAGNAPDKSLLDVAKKHDNIIIKVNPTEEEMLTLISSAQLHVLPTFQATGVKLKLLKALFSGGDCLVNKAMVNELEVHDVVEIAEGINEWRYKVQNLLVENSPKKNQHLLAQVLREFSDDVAAEKIISLL